MFFKDLEKKIVNVLVKELFVVVDMGNIVKEGRFFFKCYYCGKKGYMIKDCFLKNNKGGIRM